MPHTDVPTDRFSALRDDALRRHAAAAAAADKLQRAIASTTDPEEIDRLQVQVGTARTQADEAQREADSFVDG